jgi:RNA-binding protein|tara:strand:+ start:11721 stop:12077 length:357 start_codon:yes stop_codon:yes gene_type:complete
MIKSILSKDSKKAYQFMKLNPKQISHLRGIAHNLSPVVMIADKGLTENVIKEIESALNSHELIKIKVAGDDRDVRKAIYTDICEKTSAVAVHQIGKQLVVYRASETIKEKHKIHIPKL